MKYISVSPYWVFDEIGNGRTIYCFAKDIKVAFTLNSIDVGTAVAIVKDAKAHTDKYDFWYEEKEEKENTENETLRDCE